MESNREEAYRVSYRVLGKQYIAKICYNFKIRTLGICYR